MKITAISSARIPSDTANSIQVMKACQALAQLGHAVTLLVPGSPPSAGEDLVVRYGLSTPFEIRHLPGNDRRLFTWQAVRQAYRNGAELLYVWPLQSAVFGRLAGLPVILEMHDLPSGLGGPFWFRCFIKMDGCRRLVLITQSLRHVIEEELGLRIREDDLRILPNGVDLERFMELPDPENARRQLGLPETHTVVCTGHLYGGRGAELFLALADDLREVHFLWVGGRADDVAAWWARADQLGLKNVTFTGFVPNQELPLYQAAADVLLMPYGQVIGISSGVGRSAEVASPMKMFEYMAAGRAIITSALPVLREVLDDSMAVFCPADDIPAWLGALQRLLADPLARNVLGSHARQAAERYTWLARARRALEGFEDIR